ncbi:hypothetical protein GDO81_023371, partial [Engystomops pustulosus]
MTMTSSQVLYPAGSPSAQLCSWFRDFVLVGWTVYVSLCQQQPITSCLPSWNGSDPVLLEPGDPLLISSLGKHLLTDPQGWRETRGWRESS